MPTTIKIFSTASKQRVFNEPPKFGNNDRQAYFELPPDARKYFETLRSVENQVNFIIQYGYFCAKGRFFEAFNYRETDIKYIHRIYGFPSSKVPIKELYQKIYGGTNSSRHRTKILELKGWKIIKESELKSLTEFANWQTEKQAAPEDMLWALVSHCWKLHWVIPNLDVLSTIISKCYSQFEVVAVGKIKEQLSSPNKKAIGKILEVNDLKTTLLAKVTKIDQSTKTQSLKKNSDYLVMFKNYFFDNQELIDNLKLTDSATRYYAHWVMKAKTFQLNQFKNRNVSYLYLLAFIQHQFYLRQDAAIAGFLTVVRTSLNKAKKKSEEFERKNNAEKNKAIDAVSDSQKRLTKLVNDIIKIVDDTTLTETRKLEMIRNQAIGVIDSHDEKFTEKADFLDSYREKERKDQILIEALIEQSRSLSLAVSKTLQLLVFDEESANPKMFEAIQYFQLQESKITQSAPIEFLLKKEKEAIFEDGSINVPLYKMFFYRHIASQIKAGELSIKYSYDYRSLDNYMISRDDWQSKKKQLINDAGLSQYTDVDKYLDRLKDMLESTYDRVNDKHANGNNGWLKIYNDGRFHVKTIATDYDQSKYISTLLANDGEIPVIQVLREVDRVCQFTDLFRHHANKHSVKEITPEIAIAGIMGLGCNIGTRRMASISDGIKDGVLVDAVNWRFSTDNLIKINKRIVAEIESLKLPDIFKFDEDCLYSSSDGKKVTVAVDSLLATYSFKYYGKDKGVSIYSFINEKQTLFHSTVFSSSHREAIYLVDGLLHNTTSTRHIHSTDTHGFTEAIFTITHLIDIEFAPRFKKIEDQVIYGFYSKTHYKHKGYKILPSRRINQKLIEDNWDDILRFMATIKLGRTSASQLFKRLNSYSKEHPLYKSLKEFGRILKSLHILVYIDDLEFRQIIQKQLNMIELSNKFSGAVFWARGKEFHVGIKEEQEKQILCKTIIQNSIIFWNYLYLTDRLLKCKNQKDRDEMIESIKKGSVLAWKHINFTGNFDFTKPASKEYQFPNYEKLKAFKVEKPENET